MKYELHIFIVYLIWLWSTKG